MKTNLDSTVLLVWEGRYLKAGKKKFRILHIDLQNNIITIGGTVNNFEKLVFGLFVTLLFLSLYDIIASVNGWPIIPPHIPGIY